MPQKILLDTDIGSDIDDAVCLAYLLAQPDCELLGITTVTGEAVRRAMLADALCKVAGRQVPIYPGAETPLLIPARQPHAPQAEALSRWPHNSDYPQNEAVEFLQHTIRQHPGEITLLAIGPLTNIAVLFALDPEIPSLLKSLVLMCGVFIDTGSKSLEWNAMLDPHAAALVYRAAPPVFRSIGLDVTRQVTMPAAEVRERFQQYPLLHPVLDFAEIWFMQREVMVFHDPLAAAVIFDVGICTFERGQVQVELKDKALLGRTWWQTGTTQHEIATQVDSSRFFKHYFSVFGE